MARRFYARDSHGRFSRTAGRGGAYRRKTSTKRKVAYGVGALAIAGGAAIGGRELYRAGGRKGFDYGLAQGKKAGAPLKGSKGRFVKNEYIGADGTPKTVRRDTTNPFSRGQRPVGKDGRARKPPKLRTARDRARQNTRIRERKLTNSKGRKETRTRRNVRRATARARTNRITNSNARRYNDAQSASRVANGVRTQSAKVKNIAGQKVARAKVKRRKRVG